MAGFKRVSLVGSEELFRPTRPTVVGEEEQDVPAEDQVIKDAVEPARPVMTPREDPTEKLIRTLHFSPEEIELLLDAVQQARFAGKTYPKPGLDKFELLSQLRLKLQGE